MDCADRDRQRLANSLSSVAAVEPMESVVLPPRPAVPDVRVTTDTAEREHEALKSEQRSSLARQQTIPYTLQPTAMFTPLSAESITPEAVFPTPVLTLLTWILVSRTVPPLLAVLMSRGSRVLLRVPVT
jgi:hypothetical protein